MTGTDGHSEAALCEAILAQARRDADETLRGAREEAGKLLAQAGAEAERERATRRAAAEAEAARRIELALATVPLEAERLRLGRIEAALETVRAEIRRRLLAREGFDYAEALAAPAAEALRRMEGEAFAIGLAPADRAALGPAWAEEVAHRAGRGALRLSLEDDPSVSEGGLTIRDAAGRQLWDNRLPARLDRLWPELRRQLALQAKLTGPADAPKGGDAAPADPGTPEPGPRA